ncbi:MAG TPA: hypothetical protein VFH78_07600 [Candidatus Thermoplasmatota archaeon]|nr:hypothetical protein [Candidatus Thermoplasmatota archaeon]
MSAPGGLFCEHKRLRTGCPQCKPSALPPAAANVTPFVTAEEREKKEARRAAREAKPEAACEAPAAEKKPAGPRGPGKPLMPTRAKKRGVSADEAAAAKPWWVKK